MVRTALYEAANVLLSRVTRYAAPKRWGLVAAKRRVVRSAPKVAVARMPMVILHRTWIRPSSARCCSQHRGLTPRAWGPSSAIANPAAGVLPMPYSTSPYAAKQFAQIKGRHMAYIDVGAGPAIVFQHGNPTSSYLWRNIMPHSVGLGRLVACDLIGMGDSDKLSPSGPDRYAYAEQRDYLWGLWDALALGDKIVFVIHDWGSALGFEWARRHPERVAGIAYMEAIVTPLTWADWPERARGAFQGFRSAGGEDMILAKNMFVERILPGSIVRKLTDEEMAEYRRPFTAPGEDRRPTLTWPQQIPIGGAPADVVAVVEDYARWLAASTVPKLFINADPGSILVGRQREFCRSWPNQTELTVKGLHFIQEDSPDEIGRAVADFVRRVRG